ARRRLEEERKEIGVCRRREALARGIGDEETAEIARRFAEKHTERAAVLEKLVDALEAESGLLEREVAEMDRLLREQMLATPPGPDPLDRARDDAEFRRLEHEQRERAAAARLEQLRRRWPGGARARSSAASGTSGGGARRPRGWRSSRAGCADHATSLPAPRGRRAGPRRRPEPASGPAPPPPRNPLTTSRVAPPPPPP